MDELLPAVLLVSGLFCALCHPEWNSPSRPSLHLYYQPPPFSGGSADLPARSTYVFYAVRKSGWEGISLTIPLISLALFVLLPLPTFLLSPLPLYQVDRLTSQLKEKADWCSELLLSSEQLRRELQERDEEIDKLESRIRELEQALLTSAESLEKVRRGEGKMRDVRNPRKRAVQR